MLTMFGIIPPIVMRSKEGMWSENNLNPETSGAFVPEALGLGPVHSFKKTIRVVLTPGDYGKAAESLQAQIEAINDQIASERARLGFHLLTTDEIDQQVAGLEAERKRLMQTGQKVCDTYFENFTK